MQYEDLVHLRAHPAWKLLRSPHAELVLSFLDRVFVQPNAASIPARDLSAQLDDELFALNQRLGEDAFPKAAAAYLDDWASDDHGWLRKYYSAGSDDPFYDLAPAVEKALLWVSELYPREFVGTESRLNTIFELLRQMVFGAESDPDERLADLRRRRADLDDEITRAEQGDITVLDAVSQRDRYQQFAKTARELLADFREVEDNFRRLDRQLRERIAGWDGPKGALLDEAVGGRTTIAQSDQGRSFQAFYDFLLSDRRQRELSELLGRLGEVEALAEHYDDRLARVHFDWIDACERTQATVRLLSEQLRRFLDDQAWLENRRVFDLLRSIESRALRARYAPKPATVMEIDDTEVEFVLPTERPLHRPSSIAAIDSEGMVAGSQDFDADDLLRQGYVDREALARGVLATLRGRPTIGLAEVLADRPIEQGLAELLGYLSLPAPGLDVVFDETRRETVGWDAEYGEVARVAEMPAVSFRRCG
ncbi:MAG TPA: DUF3375 domain-containing protein [Acidimicrobiales bacterium]|nr:DUF3375 domain-containing protein [Acidimicrobiales bacterium]